MSAIKLPLSHLKNCDELLEMLENIHKAEKTETHYIVQRNDLDRLKNKRNETLLFVAVKTGNFQILKLLVEAGADVNVQNSLGQTPLLLILIITDISTFQPSFRPVIEILCASNANIHQTDKLGNSPVKFIISRDCIWGTAYDFVNASFLNIIHRQCMNDAEMTAKQLIDLKYPLYRVVDLRNAEVIKNMILRGCPVNSRHPRQRFSALHRAVELGDLEIIKVLIEQGASPVVVDSNEQLPIDHYGSAGIHQPEIIKILLTRTAIHLGDLHQKHAPQYFRKALEYGTRKIVRTTLKRVGLNDPIGPRGMFPLHYLAQNPHADLTEELRGREVDVNVRDEVGQTPLHCAAECSPINANTFRFLLQNGANPNSRNAFFWTILFKVCANTSIPKEKYREIVEMLLEYGLDVVQTTKNLMPVFDLILTDGRFYLAKPLLKHLAMLDEMKEPIDELIRNKINSRAEFKSIFDVCKAELADMKNDVINKKLTLHTIISKQISDEKILKSYSPSLLSKLETWKKKLQPDNYYHTVIKKRISIIISKIEVLQKASASASAVLCKLLKMGNNPYHIIVTEILSYLNSEDYQTLIKLDI